MVGLRLRGFSLSIDDFGTGNSSMSNLRQLPFQELKIDLEFVRAAIDSPKAAAIVRQSITLGKACGMTVLAEGVENLDTWNWLKKEGCDSAQGYFIGKPMNFVDLSAWAQNWHRQKPA